MWQEPAQAPERAAADGRGAGSVGRSRGGCPTARDTPLPVPHNGENQTVDLPCHTRSLQRPLGETKVTLAPSPRALAAWVTLGGEAECPGEESLAQLPGRCVAWQSSEVKSHKTRYSVTDAGNLIKALGRLPSGGRAAYLGHAWLTNAGVWMRVCHHCWERREAAVWYFITAQLCQSQEGKKQAGSIESHTVWLETLRVGAWLHWVSAEAPRCFTMSHLNLLIRDVCLFSRPLLIKDQCLPETGSDGLKCRVTLEKPSHWMQGGKAE